MRAQIIWVMCIATAVPVLGQTPDRASVAAPAATAADVLAFERDVEAAVVRGDVAITFGKYLARYKTAEPGRREFTVWFERVYARRDGRWQFLSHRTVNGPNFVSEPAGAGR